jgi:hypothetical protein
LLDLLQRELAAGALNADDVLSLVNDRERPRAAEGEAREAQTRALRFSPLASLVELECEEANGAAGAERIFVVHTHFGADGFTSRVRAELSLPSSSAGCDALDWIVAQRSGCVRATQQRARCVLRGDARAASARLPCDFAEEKMVRGVRERRVSLTDVEVGEIRALLDQLIGVGYLTDNY